jgi:hypothetical protein
MRTKLIRILVTLLALLSFLSASAFAGQGHYKGFPREEALITVQELKSLIDAGDRRLQIVVGDPSSLAVFPAVC